MARICLVSCSSLKANGNRKASELYLSPLFKHAKEFASDFDRWYILSAKYGLVNPNSVIEPYDKTLRKMTRLERCRWADNVFMELVKHTEPNDEITFIAGLHYRKHLIPILSERGNTVLVPMEGMSIGKQLKWLKDQIQFPGRVKHLEKFYSMIDELSNALGGKRILSECTGKMKWPERGVYFFFEYGEYRSSQPNDIRVVRVGTHMVSENSKATFWNRLRTHRGTERGSGNHRGSIFRLHVGEAIIRRSNGDISSSTWGKGQTALAGVRMQEESLEREVSKYIGGLSFLWVEVPDKAGPDSDRAYIEKNSVGLLSGLKNPFDKPSKNWLGNFSSNDAIRKSGLWNVNYVDHKYDKRFLKILAKYVAATVGKCSFPQGSIAPNDWYLSEKGKDSRGQMYLFSEG